MWPSSFSPRTNLFLKHVLTEDQYLRINVVLTSILKCYHLWQHFNIDVINALMQSEDVRNWNQPPRHTFQLIWTSCTLLSLTLSSMLYIVIVFQGLRSWSKIILCGKFYFRRATFYVDDNEDGLIAKVIIYSHTCIISNVHGNIDEHVRPTCLCWPEKWQKTSWMEFIIVKF